MEGVKPLDAKRESIFSAEPAEKEDVLLSERVEPKNLEQNHVSEISRPEEIVSEEIHDAADLRKLFQDQEIIEIDKNIQNKIEENNIDVLTKMRNFGSKKAVQAALASVMLLSNLPEAMATTPDSSEKIIKTEIKQEKKDLIADYDVNNFKKVQLDTIQYLNKDFLRQVSSETLIKNEEEAKKQIVGIMMLVEHCKLKAIQQISKEKYAEKLMTEMNISKEEAIKHQNTRISNIQNISYNIVPLSEIQKQAGKNSNAYYKRGSNEISVPVDMQLNTRESIEEWKITILHEIFHESTMAERGMSEESWKTLKESFVNLKGENYQNIKYYSDPREMIVRKNILDLEMEKLGIKKYGEEFKEKHLKLLIKYAKKGKLSTNSIELMNHLNENDLIKIMNELADNNNGNYAHPGWDYNNPQT